MTPDEIAEAVKKGTMAALAEDRKQFYVAPEAHYNHHRFIEKAMNFVDKTTGTIMGTGIRIIVGGFFLLLFAGFIFVVSKEVLK